MKYRDFYQHFHNYHLVSSQEIKNFFGVLNPVQLSQWLKKGLLKQIKRGWYYFPDKKPDLFYIANRIKTSYISLETALSFYQLIPETVYSVTSITIEKPVQIDLQWGTIKYYHVKKELFFDYQLIKFSNKGQKCKIALPEKALFDLVYLRKDLDSLSALKELRLAPYRFSFLKIQKYLSLVKHDSIRKRLKVLILYLKTHAQP